MGVGAIVAVGPAGLGLWEVGLWFYLVLPAEGEPGAFGAGWGLHS